MLGISLMERLQRKVTSVYSPKKEPFLRIDFPQAQHSFFLSFSVLSPPSFIEVYVTYSIVLV